jgi:uncharacterized protein YwbE
MNSDLVTKADLKQFKNDISEELETKLGAKFDTKFEEKFSGLRVQMAQNSFDIHDLKIEVSGLKNEMNEKFDTVITTLDGIAGLITDGRVEKAATESALHRHESKLEDHEIRIGNLEKKVV